jgi:adenine/guanine/hypoxanthine permease
MRIYLVDGLCNAVVAPLLGTAIVTPFIETAAGIVVGARTGLASVVTGALFLISCFFARSIATIIPSEASGGAILVACFFIIQGKRVYWREYPLSITNCFGQRCTTFQAYNMSTTLELPDPSQLY